MKTKLMLLITIGALAVVANAQNIHTSFPRGSARQPAAFEKSSASVALNTMHSAGATSRISADAVNRFAGADSTSRISEKAVNRFAAPNAVVIGPNAHTGIIDPLRLRNAVNKSGTRFDSLRLTVPPTAIKGNPVSQQ